MHALSTEDVDLLKDLCRNWGIGLTGAIATGKSFVAAIMRKHGALVIDADVLARQVVAPGRVALSHIRERFGDVVITSAGGLDRAQLGKIVFTNEAARRDLEAITHPAIDAELLSTLKRENLHYSPRNWVYEAPLLIERHRHTLFKALWVTTCDERLQLARLMARDKLSETDARKRITAQLSASQKASLADSLIDTSYDENRVAARVVGLMSIIGLC